MGYDISISVIIPVYNAEVYIDRCLESILNQTYKNLEILLIDDGSIDKSQEKCKGYAEKYDNIFVYRKKNGGAADARNYGIDIARGEYIAFVDIDDFIHPKYFEILYDNCKKYNAEISICQFKITRNSKIEQNIKRQELKCKNNIDVLYDCCSLNKTSVVTPWCKLFKKNLFEEIRFPVGRTYEDLATAHKLMYKAKKIVFSNLELYYYYMSENSVTRKSYSLHNFISENLAQDERLEFYKKLKNKDLYQYLLISVERNRIANYCKAKKYLKKNIAEQEELRDKFLVDYTQMDFSRCKLIDRVLFRTFKFFPWICIFVLYPIYEYRGNKKWS